jgi:hypothetical protein
MNPFIPDFSFPITLNFGSRKKDNDGEKKSATPEVVSSVSPTVQTNGICDICLNLDEVLMIGVVISILILSTAVLVYAARS